MDLLNGYGSDASDDDGEPLAPPPSISQNGAAVPKSDSTLMPPPARPAAPATGGTKVSDGPKSDFDSKLWSRMPQPTAHATSTSGLTGIPPPSAEGSRAGRKVVSMQLPFRKELLAAALDSDDDDEPASKRVKTTGAKSRLMDLLPPPKHDRGSSAAALGAGAAALTGKPSSSAALTAAKPAAQQLPAAGTDARPGSLPADFFGSNEAYRVADDGDGYVGGRSGYPGEPSYAAVGPSASAAAVAGYPAGYPGYGSHSGAGAAYPAGYAAGTGAGPPPPYGYGYGDGHPGAAVGGEPEDLIEAALRAEQERASKRGGVGGGGGGVKLVEINAKDLTRMDPAAKEAAQAAREALGPEYALALRRSAQPFEGSKMARRKHQIGTLLFNARMQELEQMEKRTQGQKSKAETAAKYGW